MSLKVLLAGASAAAFALTAPVWAADEPHREVQTVVVTDGPGGGKEVHRQCRIVIEEEHSAGGHGGEAHMGVAHMMMMDASKGPITREQFLADHAKMFDEMDANHDGKLDADEIKAAHAHHAGMAGGSDEKACHDMMAEHMGEHGDMHGGMHGDMHGGEEMTFESLDANHDGRLTFDEFSAHFHKAFDQLDKGHKGYLSKEDWPNHIVVMMRHARHGDDKQP